MDRWDRRYLGWETFPDGLSDLEIQRYFTPTDDQAQIIAARRGHLNRLGLALHLGFLKLSGRSLAKFERVPGDILNYLGVVTQTAAPDIATLRSLYRRRSTLFEHQNLARQVLGRSEISEHAERGLRTHLRRQAVGVYTLEPLETAARVWMVDHNYIVKRDREIRALAVRALRQHEGEILAAIKSAVDKHVREGWIKQLLKASPDRERTVMEWLQQPPRRRSSRALDSELAKVEHLRSLGADQLALSILPLAGLEHFSRRVSARKPSALPNFSKGRSTLGLACFIRLQLLRLTDTSLDLVDHQIAGLWRGARENALKAQASRLAQYRTLVGGLNILAGDERLTADEMRRELQALLVPFKGDLADSQVNSVRRALATNQHALRGVLKAARGMNLQVQDNHGLSVAFSTLDQLASETRTTLPEGSANPFGRSWQSLIDQPDRVQALDSYRAATAMLVKRSLKNKSATVTDSLLHQATEKRLIPASTWNQERPRLLRDLGMRPTAEPFLKQIDRTIEKGLSDLAQAVTAGDVVIDDDGIHIPKRIAAAEDLPLEAARRAIASAYQDQQLTDIMIEVDARTRFSWTLLGRPARSERELITLYIAVLALGSDLTIAELTRMVPRASADAISTMVASLQLSPQLRQANDDVVRYMRRHRVSGLWGSGLGLSSDMMSLDTTRHLWNARLDPRRKGYAVGTYPHVLDQWSIAYDQPIVLNRWQAGAAIEGALRQTVVEKVDKLAVDTHGFTYFAMALAKGVGFDLCPRLAGLSDRKLHLPRGFTGHIPEILRPVIAQDRVSPIIIEQGWDQFMRLCASVKAGWYPATDALEQYGSVSQGDAVHFVGVRLGKLLRTIYLCDYFSNPTFRFWILDLLNQGEAVHSLQRVIHDGNITAKHGRSLEQMTAISGALTLLTNIVMAWNTSRIQREIDLNPEMFTDQIAAKIAPIGYAHINMRGIMTFDLIGVQSRLIELPGRSRGARTGRES